jgi:hypothetical protein
MDLHYRALGKAGMWRIRRLQTEPDCERGMKGLYSDDQTDGEELGKVVRKLLSTLYVCGMCMGMSGWSW